LGGEESERKGEREAKVSYLKKKMSWATFGKETPGTLGGGIIKARNDLEVGSRENREDVPIVLTITQRKDRSETFREKIWRKTESLVDPISTLKA